MTTLTIEQQLSNALNSTTTSAAQSIFMGTPLVKKPQASWARSRQHIEEHLGNLSHDELGRIIYTAKRMLAAIEEKQLVAEKQAIAIQKARNFHTEECGQMTWGEFLGLMFHVKQGGK
jgi:hypothetical protein